MARADDAGFAQERQVIGLGRRRQAFEVEEDALDLGRDEAGLEVVQQLLARDGIGQQAGHPRPVPFALDRVLDHRYEPRPRHRCGDDRVAAQVGEARDDVIGPGHRYPRRDKPVEIADMPLERRGARIVPRRVEAHRERRAHRRGTAREPGGALERMADRMAGIVRQLAEIADGGAFDGERQRDAGRGRDDRRREQPDRRTDQHHERGDGDPEAPPPPPARIVEYRALNHERKLSSAAKGRSQRP